MKATVVLRLCKGAYDIELTESVLHGTLVVSFRDPVRWKKYQKGCTDWRVHFGLAMKQFTSIKSIVQKKRFTEVTIEVDY